MGPHQLNCGGTPRVTEMQVIPVAGHDSMLLNLGGVRDDAMAM